MVSMRDMAEVKDGHVKVAAPRLKEQGQRYRWGCWLRLRVAV